jgi:propanol-preferring alcohol dehydrogenase
VKAALVRELPSAGFELADVAEPEPERDDEVVVQVEACGICGTDLHILAGEAYRPELPFVLGHEPVGRVVAAGAAAGEWLGRRVTATLFEGCGACACCADGDERLCPDLRSILGVLGRNGAFAERFAVPARQLVAVPEALASDEAATLVDAGATASNAARVVLAHDRRRIAIAGGGPVGMLVAELLAAEGRTLVVAEANPARRAALEARGHAVAAGFDDVADGELDCVVECSGSPHAPAWALDRLQPRGLLVLAGYAAVPQFDFAPVARKELTIRGIRSGSRADLERVLALAAERRIALPATRAWALEDIDQAFSALRRGAVDGKAVIQPERGDNSRQEA